MSTKTETTPAAVTSIDGPANLLPAEPVIETDDDVNAALSELAFIDAHIASASHSCDAQIRKLRDALEEELGTTFGDDDFIAYPARCEQLKAALKLFVETHRPQLKTANGTKSEEFRHGIISWVKSRDTVQYAKDVTHAKALEALDMATAKIIANGGGLIKRLADLANSLRLFGRDKQERMLALFVDVHATIKLPRVLKALKDKNLTKAQAKKWWLIFKKGDDEFAVKPHKYEAPRR